MNYYIAKKQTAMIDKFDKYILKFALEDFAEDYWYDEGVTIAEQMLDEFDSDDWDMLQKTIPERTAEWQKRVAYCMNDGRNPH